MTIRRRAAHLNKRLKGVRNLMAGKFVSPSTQTIEDAEVHQEDVGDTDIGLEYSKEDMAPPTTGPAAARVAYAAPMLVGVLRHIPFSSWHES